MIGTRALAAGVLCWLVCGGSAAALERKPLPPFHALTPAGAAVGSDRLSTEIRWLLVYLTPTNPSSARLLSALAHWQNDQLVSRVVIIVGGPRDAAQAFIQKLTSAAPAPYRWLADPQLEAGLALGIAGSPVLIGVDRGVTEWSLAGVLDDPAALESVVRRWVEY